MQKPQRGDSHRSASTTTAMPDEILLNEAANAVWQMVKDYGPIELSEVVKQTGIDQAQVSAAATEAASQGYIKIDERESDEFVKNSEIDKHIENYLPEYKAACHLADVGGSLPMQEFIAWSNANNVAVNEVLKWGTTRGWIEKAKTNEAMVIALTATGAKSLKQEYADADIELWYYDKPTIPLDALPISPEVRQRLDKLLSKRPELGRLKKRVER